MGSRKVSVLLDHLFEMGPAKISIPASHPLEMRSEKESVPAGPPSRDGTFVPLGPPSRDGYRESIRPCWTALLRWNRVTYPSYWTTFSRQGPGKLSVLLDHHLKMGPGNVSVLLSHPLERVPAKVSNPAGPPSPDGKYSPCWTIFSRRYRGKHSTVWDHPLEMGPVKLSVSAGPWNRMRGLWINSNRKRLMIGAYI